MTEKKLFDIKFYTLQEAAEILDVTLTTMRSYVTKGVIPGRKVGGKWIISENALVEHVAGPSDSLTKGSIIKFDSRKKGKLKSYETKSFSKIGYQHGCCYKSGIPQEEMEDILNMLAYLRIKDHAGKSSYLEKLKDLTNSLIQALKQRYPRVRISIYSPEDEASYGFISVGMKDNFRKKFDSFPAHPLKLRICKIDSGNIDRNLSKNFGVFETLKIMCNEQIDSFYKDKFMPEYIKDLGFGTLINHAITIKLKNPFSKISLSISLDFGDKERTFYFEELEILESVVGNYFGQIIGFYLLMSSMDFVERKYIEEDINNLFGQLNQNRNNYRNFEVLEKPLELDDIRVLLKFIDRINLT